MFRIKRDKPAIGSGVWIDSALSRPRTTLPNDTAGQNSGSHVIKTGPDTFIIPGDTPLPQEKVDEFIGKTKSDYQNAFNDILKLIPQKNKVAPPKPLPQVSPFLDTPIAQPQPKATPSATLIPAEPPKTFQSVKEAQEAWLKAVSADTAPVAPFGSKIPDRPSQKPTPENKPIRQEPVTIGSIDQRSHLPGDPKGRLVSVSYDDARPGIISVITAIFFVITFSYTTLTLLAFGLILALAITLNNSGTPGFMYLKYFPNVGLLPIATCLAAIIFMYIGYKIRDASRRSWLMGILAAASVPVVSVIALPSMTYPLIRLVSVYAGTLNTSINPRFIDLSLLKNFYSLFLLFEAIVLLLIIFMKDFRFRNTRLSGNAVTSLVVMVFLFFIPISVVMSYGYFDANSSDYGYAFAQSLVPYRILKPDNDPYGRINSSYFLVNEPLAGVENAVKVSYDLPLPMLVDSANSMKVTVTQAQVKNNFSLPAYMDTTNSLYDENPLEITVPFAAFTQGFITRRRKVTTVWYLTGDRQLIAVSSGILGDLELIDFARYLE